MKKIYAEWTLKGVFGNGFFNTLILCLTPKLMFY